MNMEINDKLDALISLTAKDCGNDDVLMFNNLDTAKTKLDNIFYIKLRQVISKHKHSTIIMLVKKCFVRVAVALMALMSLGFLTIMATPDLREAFFEAVVEWYENYISIQFKPIENDTNEMNITNEISLMENSEEESKAPVSIAPPTIIEKVMKPTFIPTGIEGEMVVSNKTMVIIDYYHGDDWVGSYQQILFRDNEKLFDNETIIIHSTNVNGYAASIIEYGNKDGQAIIWTDGMYYYQIYLFTEHINEEELISIAESVQ